MRAALIVAALVAGCGFDAGGLGGASGSQPAGDGGTLVGDGGVDPTDGGGELGDDAMPVGAITYFRGATCPVGWVPYEPARGRFVVATIAAKPTGATNGDPLASGEDRAHTHGLSLTFTLGDQSFIAAAGGSNGGVAGRSAAKLAGSTSEASSGLPYVQLLVCRKTSKPLSRPLPAGLQLFFETSTCPAGWAQTEEAQGRFVVGLPKGAPADQTFGRGPLATTPRTHKHSASATLATRAHGIAVFSGCCADGYAADRTYTATAETEPASTGLPTIELLLCATT